MKKKLKYTIPFFLIIFVIVAFCVVTGGEIYNVVLTDYETTENASIMVLYVDVTSSMGYVRNLSMEAVEDKVFVTFYSTYGINSSYGEQHIFPIELPKDCTEIYFVRADDEFELVLKKIIDDVWQRP